MTSFDVKHVLQINPSQQDHEDADYIFDIKTSSENDSKILVSASDMNVRIYDINTFQETFVTKVHQDRINGISYSPASSQQFYTCSADCTVKGWDARNTSSSQSVFSFKMEDEVQALACNIHDNLLAVGVGTEIMFFDVRKASSSTSSMKSCLLGTYSDVHSDIVTQLEFSLHHPSLLMSGSEDGLLCMYDTATAEAEEAVLSILNTDCPVRKFGFFGPNMEGVYALSTVESASFWHHPSAQRLAYYPDIRENLGVDYLVDCCYEASSSKLQLLTGMYDGSASFLDIDPSGYRSAGLSLNGHKSTVRCCVPLPVCSPSTAGQPINAYLTGGEDGRIVYWKRNVMGVDHGEIRQSIEEDVELEQERDKFDLAARTEQQAVEDAAQLARDEEELQVKSDSAFHSDAHAKKQMRQKKRMVNFRNGLRQRPY